jgi:glycogen synthase
MCRINKEQIALLKVLKGMDADEDNEPQNLEHFGMTIIEGMLNGCIPIVYSKGGPSETVRSTKVGFMFSSLDELTNILNQLQSYKEDILNNLSRKSVIEANNLIKKNKKNFTKFIKN